jgi:UrcA family protein
MRKSIVTCLAALAASVAFAAPAAAEDAITASVTVSYADLDVTAPADAAKLDQRIEAAAEDVCVKPDIRDLKAMASWQACKDGAVAGAQEQLSLLAPFDSIELASAF